RHGWVPRLGLSAGTGGDLEARVVGEPGEAPGINREEVVVGVTVLAPLDARLVPLLEPFRGCLGDVLLPEAGRAGAVRESMQVEGPVPEMRQHRRRDRGVEADQLTLRDRRLGVSIRPGPTGEERLVEVRQLQVAATD